MDRDIRTALGLAAGIAVWIVAFIFLVRYAVPAILGAPFSASLITAAAVGVVGVLALVWGAWRLWIWASRALKR